MFGSFYLIATKRDIWPNLPFLRVEKCVQYLHVLEQATRILHTSFTTPPKLNENHTPVVWRNRTIVYIYINIYLLATEFHENTEFTNQWVLKGQWHSSGFAASFATYGPTLHWDHTVPSHISLSLHSFPFFFLLPSNPREESGSHVRLWRTSQTLMQFDFDFICPYNTTPYLYFRGIFSSLPKSS